MRWMEIDQMSAAVTLPEGYRLEQLARSEIPALVRFVKNWFPDVSVGGASGYVREDFYTERVSLAGEPEKDVHLSQTSILLVEAIGRSMGMGLIYGMATSKIPHIQRAFERLGWQLIGITPGYDREMVAPGVVKRVYEAVYAKILVSDASLLHPQPRNMTARTKAFFHLLFPRAPLAPNGVAN